MRGREWMVGCLKFSFRYGWLADTKKAASRGFFVTLNCDPHYPVITGI